MLTVYFPELTPSVAVDGSAYNDSNSTEAMSSGIRPEQEMRWGMLSLSIFIIATAAGNVLVCLAVTWEKRLQNMANYFLMSLAIADLLVALLVMPLAMIVEIYGYFPFGQSFCVLWATSDVLLCTASIWHMCTMSMDRYFTIRYPIKYGRNKTKKMMILKITFVWVISFAVSAPLAIAGFLDYSHVYTSGKCVISIKNFIIYGSIFAFYVPLIIMVTTYTLTIRILKQNRIITANLDSKYPSIVRAESTAAPHRTDQNGTSSKVNETTRLNGIVGQSPLHSGYTITSAGLTSALGSSGESPRSPEMKVFGCRNLGLQGHPVETLKLADETNYLRYAFDRMLSDTHGCKPTKDCNGCLHSAPPTVRLRSASRISRSSSQPSMADFYDRAVRLRRRSSEMNLGSGKRSEDGRISSPSTRNDSPNRRHTPTNHIPTDHSVETEDVSPYSRSTLSPKMHKMGPIVFRMTPVLDEHLINGHEAENKKSFMCLDLEKVLSHKSPSCLTTQTSDTSSERPFETSSPVQCPYEDRATVSALRNHGNSAGNWGLLRPMEGKTNEGTFDRLSARLNSNESQKEFSDIICRPDEEETRGLLVIPNSVSGRKNRPAPWSNLRTSFDNGVSKSENRTTFARTRVLPRRQKPPRACARKIGLMARSRSSNERKASKVLGIIFAVFVLAWTPFFMLNIISVMCQSCMESVSESMSSTILWLGYLSSLANPIIYTMFSTSFRTVFYRILTCQYQTSSCCLKAQRRNSSSGLVLCWFKTDVRRTVSPREPGFDSRACGV